MYVDCLQVVLQCDAQRSGMGTAFDVSLEKMQMVCGIKAGRVPSSGHRISSSEGAVSQDATRKFDGERIAERAG